MFSVFGFKEDIRSLSFEDLSIFLKLCGLLIAVEKLELEVIQRFIIERSHFESYVNVVREACLYRCVLISIAKLGSLSLFETRAD